MLIFSTAENSADNFINMIMIFIYDCQHVKVICFFFLEHTQLMI